MAFGFNLQASNGDIAFSTDYSSMSFVEKYTLYSSSATYVYNITCPSYPLVFIQDVENNEDWGYCQGYLVDNGNNSYTFTVYATPELTISVYVFSYLNTNVPTTGYGINTFNSDGSLSFTSTKKILKISGYVVTTPYSGAEYYRDMLLDYGTLPTNCAIHIPSIGIFAGGTPFVNPVFNVGAKKINSTTIRLLRVRPPLGQIPPNIPIYRNTGYQYVMAIDSSLYD